MGKHILRDASIVLDDADLSRFSNSVELNLQSAEDEVAGFQDEGSVTLPGDRADTITIECYQDFDDGSVDAIAWEYFESQDEFDFDISPFPGAASPTNPHHVGTAVLPSYTPVRGARGEVHKVTLTLKVNGKTTRDIGA